MSILINILLIILGIIAVVFFFGFTIFIHEFGHFIAGKLLGLKAPIFSIGFGPCLWKKQIDETEFRISLIPLGGYVSLPELDPTGMELIQGDGDQKEEAVTPAVWWKRIIVAFAGPFGNILFAIILALFISVFPKHSNVPEEIRFSSDGVVVGYVEEDSDAAAAGLRVGDVIHEVNDRSVEIYSDFVQEVHLGSFNGYATVCVSNMIDGVEACLRVPVSKPEGEKYYSVPGFYLAANLVIGSVVTNSPAESAGIMVNDYIVKCNGERLFSSAKLTDSIKEFDSIDLTLFRDGKFVDVTVIPEFDEKEGRKLIGISYSYAADSVRSWNKYRNPIDQLKGDASSIFRILDSLFTPKEKGEASRTAGALGGPISIVTVMWFNVLSGFVSFIAFIRFLNINLAILNLLPIPILDGGHIMFALWRGIFRRELPAKVITIVCNLFAILLIAFFVFVSCNDVGAIYKMFKSNDSASTEEVEETKTDETGEAKAEEVEKASDSKLLDGEYEIVPAEDAELNLTSPAAPAAK